MTAESRRSVQIVSEEDAVTARPPFDQSEQTVWWIFTLFNWCSRLCLGIGRR